MKQGWIGVDQDGTLTKTMEWNGPDDGRLGADILPMINRVQRWLDEGWEVRILTARAAAEFDPYSHHRDVISEWSMQTFGQVLPITAEKDPHMIVQWDDRVVQVVRNTGWTPEELGRHQYTNLPKRV